MFFWLLSRVTLNHLLIANCRLAYGKMIFVGVLKDIWGMLLDTHLESASYISVSSFNDKTEKRENFCVF